MKDIINIHPAYSSVMVSLDNEATLGRVTEHLKVVLRDMNYNERPEGRIVEVPVIYGGENGPDMARVSDYTGLDQGEVIKRHSEGEYLVYFIGFLNWVPLFRRNGPIYCYPSIGFSSKIRSGWFHWNRRKSNRYISIVVSWWVEYYRQNRFIHF